jgi:hypothetical protein
MKRYSVALVRERLSQALDEAEGGQPVIIERRGVRYRLSVEAPPAARTTRKSVITTVDPSVDEGAWTWEWSAGRTEFRKRPAR